MEKHTPGLWEADEGSTPGCWVVFGPSPPAANGEDLCLATVWDNVPPEQVRANAELMAAAPSLLAALEELAELFPVGDDYLDFGGPNGGPIPTPAEDPSFAGYYRQGMAIRQARAALVKARGNDPAA